MTKPTHLRCTCGQVRLQVEGAPIVTAECCCTSCRTAGERLQTLPGAPPVLGPNGATHFVLYRKDRVRFAQGADRLRVFRLGPHATTRRAVAICCNTPVFLEFQGGHWLSLYSAIWPKEMLPPPDLRTMTSDLADPSVLPDDVPNYRRQSGKFFWKILGAWIAMGFRNPKIDVREEIHA